eukprot:CAMPEP_0116900790 /NCGR_PEP_ID=MMETSP0467-20121206/8936_1 /TAXON_ID=283647 /ORGANISM="Mesodinium pulex, Strain SPMC105" /LENGTH=126 /DNA_ID=CAMNT_0004574117 /DNA_START=941 /DNA_END=1321 /DNA_ORIENTATION=+
MHQIKPILQQTNNSSRINLKSATYLIKPKTKPNLKSTQNSEHNINININNNLTLVEEEVKYKKSTDLLIYDETDLIDSFKNKKFLVREDYGIESEIGVHHLEELPQTFRHTEGKDNNLSLLNQGVN